MAESEVVVCERLKLNCQILPWERGARKFNWNFEMNFDRGAKELFTGELLLREGLINWILKERNEI